MVTFLRDVMIMVAIVASLVALVFYPGQESGSHATAHDIPVGAPKAPVITTTAGADSAGASFEKRP